MSRLDIQKLYKDVIYGLYEGIKYDMRKQDEFRRIAYSYGSPNNIFVQLMLKPVDVVNPMRAVENRNFSVDTLGQPIWRTKFISSKLNIVLGDGIVGQPKEGTTLDFFEGGIARVQLEQTDDLVTAILTLEDLISNKTDYHDEIRNVKQKAKEDYEKNNPFDSGYKLSHIDYAKCKKPIKDYENAVKKKQSQWLKNQQHAVSAAIDKFNIKRNENLLTSGLNEVAIRMFINGTLTESCELYWYPTVLDMCRMLKHITCVPQSLMVSINDNDMNKPSDSWFSGDVILESWNDVNNGLLAFDDIRDSWHKDKNKQMRPYPIAKPKRWKYIQNISTDVHDEILSKFSRRRPNNYIEMINGRSIVKIGDLGKIYCKISQMSGQPFNGNKAIIMKNGIVLLYSEDGQKLITSMIMTPETMIKFMKHAVTFSHESQAGVIPIWLLRRCFRNMVDITSSDDDYSFVKTPGTRRYIV